MTNAEKLQQLYTLTGPGLFEIIIQQLGPGPLYIPKNAYKARITARNKQIKGDFFSPECAGMQTGEAVKLLGKRYELSPDRIRKILNTSGSG